MKKPPRSSAKAPAISILIEEPRWREDPPALRLVRRAVRLALTSPPHLNPLPQGGRGKSVTLLLSNDAKLRALNASFRRLDKPTNVLSFPATAGAPSSLGDIAMAYGVVKREARAHRKNFAAHAAHLALHGT